MRAELVRVIGVLNIVSIMLVGCESSVNIKKLQNYGESTNIFRNIKEKQSERDSTLVRDIIDIDRTFYRVGEDISAGEYILIGNRGTKSYYEVLSNLDGTKDSILHSEEFDANRYITLNDGEILNIKDCTLVDQYVEPLDVSKYTLNGMYKVGVDIPSGEYTLKALKGTGIYEVVIDSTNNTSSIKDSKVFDGTIEVSLTDGSYLKLSNDTELVGYINTDDKLYGGR